VCSRSGLCRMPTASESFSGADLKEVLREAVQSAVRLRARGWPAALGTWGSAQVKEGWAIEKRTTADAEGVFLCVEGFGRRAFLGAATVTWHCAGAWLKACQSEGSGTGHGRTYQGGVGGRVEIEMHI